MRASIFHKIGDPSVLAVTSDFPKPVLAGDSDLVLVKIVAASVNPIDYKIREGSVPFQPRKLPAVVGRDLSGVVEAVGAKVTKFKPGDEVFGMAEALIGTYCEYVVVSQRSLVKKPSLWSHREAAALPLVCLTAYQSVGRLLEKAGRGKKVLVIGGSGGVGSTAVRLYSALGAEVYATCSGRNAEYVRGLGAHRVIDYTSEDFAVALKNVEFEYVLDTVGGKADRDKARNLLSYGGTFIAVTIMDPSVHSVGVGTALGVMFDYAKTWSYERIWRGINYSFMLVRDFGGDDLEKVVNIFLRLGFKPNIDAVFPLDKAADAHAQAQQGRTRGKIVIDVQQQ
eukprot:TRINITY_DN3622_c0_g1_i1.p1 TRINITY_DN3622_c0_g1~~TRINITY_DN3622_c0_g1_i1.p1  ORF type:complete len:339 (+),score=109.75 TRINITY_DN3622_c0_g1_i1:305-1321(+)